MAEFRTAYLQAMVPFDVAVTGTVAEETAITAANRKAAILRGDLVTLTPATSTRPGYIAKAAALAAATHMVALTDMTIGGGHAATDLQDYRSSELIGATRAVVSVGAPILATDTVKKVGLYPLWDKNDIILDADGMDLAAL